MAWLVEWAPAGEVLVVEFILDVGIGEARRVGGRRRYSLRSAVVSSWFMMPLFPTAPAALARQAASTPTRGLRRP